MLKETPSSNICKALIGCVNVNQLWSEAVKILFLKILVLNCFYSFSQWVSLIEKLKIDYAEEAVHRSSKE